MTTHSRIDTHHHVIPPSYSAWITAHGATPGGRPVPEWSVESALAMMATNDIQTGMLSISTPGVFFEGNAEARPRAREANEFAAQLVAKQPTRFGLLATLTLPDVEGALIEAAFAFDVLKADGVVLPSSVGGMYLGNPAFDPLMEELNRRKAVVFEHPSAPVGGEVAGIPAFAADFLLDTVRSAISLAKSGCMERYPDLKIILSHAGGFLPYVAERIAPVCGTEANPEEGLRRLRQFYFDTALASGPYALPALLAFADPTHITFGSDTPFAPKATATHFTQMLDVFALSADQRYAIDRGNAETLFPRLAQIDT